MQYTIEFGLPNGAGGMAGAHAAGQLRKQLKDWSERYKTTVTAELDRHDHRAWLRVYFSSEAALTLFALTFEYRGFMGWRRVTAE